VELQVLDELFSCPIIYQYPETLSRVLMVMETGWAAKRIDNTKYKM